jgi:hypothetical protein
MTATAASLMLHGFYYSFPSKTYFIAQYLYTLCALPGGLTFFRKKVTKKHTQNNDPLEKFGRLNSF